MLFKKDRKVGEVSVKETAKAVQSKEDRHDYSSERRFTAARSRAYDIPRRFMTETEIKSATAVAKSQMSGSEELVGRLGFYEVKRLEYEIYVDRFRFGIDREAAQIRVQENQRLILATKLRTYFARICERLDNRRYMRALNLKCENGRFRGIARPAILNREKAQLLELLRRKHELNKELMVLYDERYKDYVGVETDESLLGVRLRAARSAYKRLYDVDLMIARYTVSPEEKARLHELMNRFVDMSVGVATMRQRIGEQTEKEARDKMRAEIATVKKEREDLEDSIFHMIATIRRKTYLDSKSGAWRWVLGISIITLVLIALFGVFHEEITEFLMDWATRGR